MFKNVIFKMCLEIIFDKYVSKGFGIIWPINQMVDKPNSNWEKTLYSGIFRSKFSELQNQVTDTYNLLIFSMSTHKAT